VKEAVLYKPLADGRVVCTACARYCKIPKGYWGFCGVRANVGGKLHLSYTASSPRSRWIP